MSRRVYGQRDATRITAYRGNVVDAARRPIWQAVGFLGMSEKTLVILTAIAKPTICGHRARNVGLVVSLVGEKAKRKPGKEAWKY